MAGLPKEERSALLNRVELTRFTAATICDRDILEQELEKALAQGYAMDREEREEDVTCIAAPLYDYSGEVVAALSISAPSSRLGKGRQQELLPMLMTTAANISRELGYRN